MPRLLETVKNMYEDALLFGWEVLEKSQDDHSKFAMVIVALIAVIVVVAAFALLSVIFWILAQTGVS